MAINFCMNCGSKLEENASACSVCGEAVPHIPAPPSEQGEQGQRDARDDQDEDFNKYADLSGFDIIGTYPTYAPPQKTATQHADAESMAAETEMRDSADPHAADALHKKTGLGRAKAAAAITAILLAAAAGGLLANPNMQARIQERLDPEKSGTAESGTEAQSASRAVQEQGAPPSVRDVKATIDEETAFDALVATYNKLQSYNERVYSCLQTYNSVIVVSDRSQREAAAGIASALLAEMDKEARALDDLGIGSASELYDDYQNVSRLLEDQRMRLAVVVESWEISLAYNNPYEHQDEILEPLRRDTGAEGQNLYLEDFDNKYWDSRPER